MLSVFGVSNTDYLVATATDSDGNTSEASSDAAAGTVAVDIEKSTNGFDADAPTGPNVAAGDDNENGLLDPGETWTYTADGRALAGPNAGTATVRGDPVDGQGEPIADLDDVTDKDDGHYFGVPPQSDDPNEPPTDDTHEEPTDDTNEPPIDDPHEEPTDDTNEPPTDDTPEEPIDDTDDEGAEDPLWSVDPVPPPVEAIWELPVTWSTMLGGDTLGGGVPEVVEPPPDAAVGVPDALQPMAPAPAALEGVSEGPQQLLLAMAGSTTPTVYRSDPGDPPPPERPTQLGEVPTGLPGPSFPAGAAEKLWAAGRGYVWWLLIPAATLLASLALWYRQRSKRAPSSSSCPRRRRVDTPEVSSPSDELISVSLRNSGVNHVCRK